jgi:hypothetical protein
MLLSIRVNEALSLASRDERRFEIFDETNALEYKKRENATRKSVLYNVYNFITCHLDDYIEGHYIFVVCDAEMEGQY